MKAPVSLQTMPVIPEDNKSIKNKLNDFIRRVDEAYRYLRADTTSIENKVDAGVTGWFDDGTNFRVTVTNGIITAIADSSGAGHS